MAKKNRDYLIDVAARHKYHNQSEQYQKKYLEWRSDPKNPHGFNFVHDSRLRTYVDGEGFLEETPVENERTALSNCFRSACIAMLIMCAVTFVKYAVMLLAFDIPNGGRAYRSSLGTGMPDAAAYAILAMNLLEYILPLVYLKASTRMPSQIAVPIRRNSRGSVGNAVIMAFVIMAFGRVVSNVVSSLAIRVKLDVPYYDYIDASGTTALVICGLVQHIVISILIEIIFRGYMLQMFRQFSDRFAVIMTSTLSAFLLYDFSQAGYLFFAGVFTGIITIRSGSLRSAILMRTSARVLTYLMTVISSLLNPSSQEILELVFCTSLLFCSVMIYLRLVANQKWSFEVSGAGSSLTTPEKFRILISGITFWVWILSTFIMSVLLVRML